MALFEDFFISLVRTIMVFIFKQSAFTPRRSEAVAYVPRHKSQCGGKSNNFPNKSLAASNKFQLKHVIQGKTMLVAIELKWRNFPFLVICSRVGPISKYVVAYRKCFSQIVAVKALCLKMKTIIVQSNKMKKSSKSAKLTFINCHFLVAECSVFDGKKNSGCGGRV